MSITEITTAAGWIAGLTIVALVATGWRKDARAGTPVARDRSTRGVFDGLIGLEEIEAPRDVRATVVRKAWAAAASSAIAIVVGALLAIVVSFALAWMVVRTTGMLER